jgi:protein-ribulosamine 3-kinase
MYQAIAEHISQHLEQRVDIVGVQLLSGGSINQVARISLDNHEQYLLKTQTGPVAENTFQIEFDSLNLLAQTGALRVPQALVYGDDFLVLEYIEPGIKASDWAENLGRQLAMLHLNTQRNDFGFACDNFLATTPQPNNWQSSWLEFWREQRLGFQLQLYAQKSGEDLLLKKGDQLMLELENFLSEVQEPAVLLHGDLWSGNAMADLQGEPVIFDPACYYGHREAEFGMMRLFGGFGPRCEAAYQEVWSFADGFENRFRLYQLYHELNHLNLFGSAYYPACLASIEFLLQKAK